MDVDNAGESCRRKIEILGQPSDEDRRNDLATLKSELDQLDRQLEGLIASSQRPGETRQALCSQIQWEKLLLPQVFFHKSPSAYIFAQSSPVDVTCLVIMPIGVASGGGHRHGGTGEQ